MSGRNAASSFIPNLTRTMSQILEKGPPPSPPPERIRAPPSTPDYPSASKREMDGESQSDDRSATNNATTAVHSPVYCRSPSPQSIQSMVSERREPREKESPHACHPLEKFQPALILENSGSVARDHLASERTFLAYVRTSLAIATTGVALVQLFAIATTSNVANASATVKRIHTFAKPLGATLVVFGLVVLVMGVKRYFVVQTALTKGIFPATRFGVAGITAILTVIIIIVFVVLISGRS